MNFNEGAGVVRGKLCVAAAFIFEKTAPLRKRERSHLKA